VYATKLSNRGYPSVAGWLENHKPILRRAHRKPVVRFRVPGITWRALARRENCLLGLCEVPGHSAKSRKHGGYYDEHRADVGFWGPGIEHFRFTSSRWKQTPNLTAARYDQKIAAAAGSVPHVASVSDVCFPKCVSMKRRERRDLSTPLSALVSFERLSSIVYLLKSARARRYPSRMKSLRNVDWEKYCASPPLRCSHPSTSFAASYKALAWPKTSRRFSTSASRCCEKESAPLAFGLNYRRFLSTAQLGSV
jgi:hypothetical protein